MINDHTVGEIIRRFLPALKSKKGISAHQLKVLDALAACRTFEMGGSAMACKTCGTIHYVLHSCRNRHCPRCQGIERELWIHERKLEILPVKYFHVVFTLPHDLLEICRFNRKVMYNLLFEKSWEVLSIFATDPKLLGAKLGAIAVLHTWDQQLKYHPHVHYIIPAGGINKEHKWNHSKNQGEFLFDVEHLSATFSARFVKSLRKLKQQGLINKRIPRNLIKKPWVVYAKQAFGNPESVVEYTGRYTHRVGISDARILNVNDTHVTFRWCNRKKGYQTETSTITGVEFLERFIEHIVPPYFRRIRHYGFLSTRNKTQYLKLIRESLQVEDARVASLTRAEILQLKFGERSWFKCRECGGELVVFESYPRKRAPPVNICAELN